MASSAEESHTEVEDKEERKKQCKYPEEAKQLPYWKLFKFADSCDILFMLVGTVAAIINGLAFPILTIIQSRIINTLGTYQNDPSKIADEVSRDSTYLIYNALVAWAGSYLYVSCWMRAGERQASKIRAQYLHAILRQNVAFFDTEMCTAEVVKNVSSDSMLVQEAISQKVGEFVQNLSQFIGGFLVGFIQVWKLAIVLVPFTPLLLLPGYFYGKALSEYENRRQRAYDKAGIVAEQAISSIRTVHAFAAEKSTLNMFSRFLEPAIKLGLRQGFAKGLAMGSNGVTFALWSFTAWYGSELIMHGHANGAQVMTTGFALLAGGLALGNATPSMRAFIEGCIVAGKIFRMIERIPPIDIEDDFGTRLEKVDGKLQFKNVSFAYPSRPHQPVFDDLELKIEASKTIALVGGSGSGKSTILALIERFYDPQTGSIYLDDVDIRKLQLKWYRDQIALVSQQPILFATTIKDNILVGKEYATIEDVVEAAKIANAHSFIVKQPLGYDTQVGEHGVQLSGGQKQRVAIARAMLRKPHILLLDEATSALDTKSERKVQEAFIKASMRRTTIVVAHRLSTIQNADYIAVIKGGKVVELGPHETLLEREDGIYKNLLRLQHVHEDLPRDYDRISSPYNQQDKVEEDMQEATSLKAEQDSICPLEIRPKHRLSLRKRKFQKQVPKASLWRLAKLNTPEWKQILCGLFGAIAFGFVQPLYAFTLGKMASALYNSDYMELKRSVRLYSTIFIGLFVASFMVNIIQHYNFAIAGEYLTKRIRERMLDAILGFEIAWFDEEKNTSGAICVRLASDAALVRTLIGDRISLMVQIGSATIVSFALGTITCWRLAFLMIAIQPIIIFCYYLKRTLLERFAEKRAKAEQEASQIAAEAVSQHRTVTAFSSHERILLIFQSKIDKSMKETVKNAYTAGFAMGVAQFILYASWGLDYWYGGILIREGKNTFSEVLMTFFVLVSTGRIVAEAGAMTPDLAKGTTATKSVFDILDRKTKIDADSNKANESLGIEKGDLQFCDIIFAYPSRPNVIVLNKFNLTIQSGQSVAVVGQSGSGKSTIVGLIERFYDPISGVILIDGQDIRNFHLKTLRQQIGLVCQEPTLFATTIRENICYGNENITETEIVRAAVGSNAHDFISALSNGYNTFVGEQGLQLSGGQRQRIAIARTILKNPKVLLLDEATSALDAESESIVQVALDRIMVGRTTIIIAHRLSTIQNASSIVVVQDGVVLEQGTHKELISKGQAGAYHSMIQMQTSNPTK